MASVFDSSSTHLAKGAAQDYDDSPLPRPIFPSNDFSDLEFEFLVKFISELVRYFQIACLHPLIFHFFHKCIPSEQREYHKSIISVKIRSTVTVIWVSEKYYIRHVYIPVVVLLAYI